MAAPLGGATGIYAKDLGQIQGLVDSFRGQQIACTEKFPVLKDLIATALTNWELRNRNALNELALRIDHHMIEVAAGNAALIANQRYATEESNRRNLSSVKAYLDSVPLDRAHEVCSHLSVGLNKEMSDLEDVMKFQFETVRARPMPANAPNNSLQRTVPSGSAAEL